MTSFWSPLIKRAKDLSASGETAELLTFYAGVLRAQQAVYEHLNSVGTGRARGGFRDDLSALLSCLPTLLEVVAETGSELLANEARRLSGESQESLRSMLIRYWQTRADHSFFAKALVQPYARLMADRGVEQLERRPAIDESRCPFCGGRPQLGLFSQEDSDSAEGSRRLLCSTCLSEWPFPRCTCPFCMEQRPSNLAYFGAPEFAHVSIEACDTCSHYFKRIDLTKFGLAAPLVDEVASAPLDVWARERGYRKIELNLVGV